MTRKAGYSNVSFQVSPEQYAAIKAAAGSKELTQLFDEMLGHYIPNYPKRTLRKRGTYSREKAKSNTPG